MEVQLTPDQKAFIQNAIGSGRFTREEDALREALALWEDRERKRAALLATLDDAATSLDCGAGIPITQEYMRELAEEVKRHGLARLTTK